jgi:hypothetical protein
MFTFFFKKTPIVLDCFTFLPDLTILFPIVRAEERIPEFWKNVPTTVKHFGINRGTMRTCPGVGDLFRSGFILQNWEDYWISTENNTIKWEPLDHAESHNSKQWGDYLKNYYHVKLISPWRIKEKTGVQFLYTNCFWHDDEFKPIVVNGSVEYKYQTTTSVNMLVPKALYPKDLIIPAGKPLAQIIPMSEKSVEIKMHTVTKYEYLKIGAHSFAFNGQYFKRKKLLKAKGL